MSKKIIISFIVCVIFIPMTLIAEYIFLKDGNIINCTIITETISNVTIKHKNSTIKTINRNNIIRILFANLYMGKVLIRLTDGKTIEAFMVDEDKDTYTFRKELYSPEEFKVPREKVLFMTRTNPTDLRGKPYETAVKLIWSSPYKPPESYNIYMKKSKNDEFTLTASTNKTEYSVSGLGKNSNYFFLVKGVDAMGKESLPSNEISVATNKPPSSPLGAHCLKEITSDGKGMKVLLKWIAPKDDEGNIKTYYIYKETETGIVKIGESDKPEFTIDGLKPNATHYFIIRSVNTAGNESDDIWVDTGKIKFDIGARACFIIPFGDLKKSVKIGYGGLITGSLRNVFLFNLDFGLEIGWWGFQSNSEKLKKGYTIPMLLRSNYQFNLNKDYALTPRVFLGYTFNSYQYIKQNYTFSSSGSIRNIIKTNYTKNTFDPICMAGVQFSYNLDESLLLYADADYGIFIKTKGYMHFASLSAGVGYRFK